MCLNAVRCSMRTKFADAAQHADAFFVIRAISNVRTRNLAFASTSTSRDSQIFTVNLIFSKINFKAEL